MLIIHRNCIAYDNLDTKDLEEVQNPAMSYDDGRCWHKITDGDESLQRSLGDSYTWEELLDGNYSDGGNVIIAPSSIRNEITPQLIKLGFGIQESYFSGEDRFYFQGNEAVYIGRGRPIGFSPINGTGGAMTKKNKAWSMPDEDWEWLESQSNQSEVLRHAIALYRQHQEGK